jgi:pyrroloquinoline quinone biosynthesis protein B
MLKYVFYFALLCSGLAAKAQEIYILGTAQDGGYPHMGCTKKCCKAAWENEGLRKYVVSLAIVDTIANKWWLIEATPDIKEQMHYFRSLTGRRYKYLPEGILLTHAHIGHYTGLMQFGREVMNTKNVPVYALPRMKKYLETNGPWGQLVSLGNIKLQQLTADSNWRFSDNISVTPMQVPHRDEYSETAGFKIKAGNKTILFIPDIDKWDKWQRNIIEEVKKVDIALLDGTFFDSTELPGRNMAEVPHPFVQETMQLFQNETKTTKAKVCFIHFNHTNPLLLDKKKQLEVIKAGFIYAVQGEIQ